MIFSSFDDIFGLTSYTWYDDFFGLARCKLSGSREGIFSPEDFVDRLDLVQFQFDISAEILRSIVVFRS